MGLASPTVFCLHDDRGARDECKEGTLREAKDVYVLLAVDNFIVAASEKEELGRVARDAQAEVQGR